MRTPISTYRLQITSDLTLDRAAGLVDYLHDLGADWVYLSPILRAVDGSDHGYDVASPAEVDPVRGGPAGLRALADAAHGRGMGVLVDIVPNHQGVAVPQQNPWWWSLLEQGRDSPYADAFDVEWEAGGGKVLIPVLGDGDEELAQLRVEDGTLRYYDNVYPLAEGTWAAGDDPQDVHARQHYELINWRRGDAELNYRRFFTVATLAGVRVEDPEVFDESHAEIKRWIDEGLVDGLRIDHPDGLRDPRQYLERLKELTGGAYVVVEKILEPGERLPGDWATAGTTGYDALGVLDRLLTDPAGEYALTSLDARLRGGEPVHWEEMIHGTKRAMADNALHAEVLRLARSVPADAGLGHDEAVDALAEILANFPVYRSYLPEGAEHLRAALDAARARRPDLAGPIGTLGELLGAEATDDAELGELARRFQQTSGMVMAKGVEDTAFYRFPRLTSLTEVGGDPSHFAVTPEEAHAELGRRAAEEPLAMTALSTHDTKRSEAVRARITVLSEAGEQWAGVVGTAKKLAEEAGVRVDDGPLVNLVLQAVVGAWPLSQERTVDYALKAAREAGSSTAWVDGDADFEDRLVRFIELVFHDPEIRAVVEGFAQHVTEAGWSNGLAAKLVQLTMPGVPDVYQGSELWAESLVDPDNRRPVDFEARAAMLARLDTPVGGTVEGIPAVGPDAAAKLLVTSRALRLRRDHPELFTGYTPLEASGPRAGHVFAFDRGGAVTVATRLPLGLAARGGFTDETLELPEGDFEDVLTHRPHSGTVALSALLSDYPVALLRRKDS
ncbi:malto-oligosyltrehalose synthase [Kocuria oceani]|uniref:malto-oligosyltrehalose synthase n=1 Tax=Kocuria oceani TaxID=988827 RepID=UPI002406409B|nr:malto-oligosyltrehalose synthase [Kocuria oceani]